MKSAEDTADAINWEIKFLSEIGVTVDHVRRWDNANFFSKNPSYLNDYGHMEYEAFDDQTHQ